MQLSKLQGDFSLAVIPHLSGPGRHVTVQQLYEAGIRMAGINRTGIFVLIPHSPEPHAMGAAHTLTQLRVNCSMIGGKVFTDPLVAHDGSLVARCLRTLFGGLMNHEIADEVKVTTGHKTVMARSLDHVRAD